MTKSLHWTRGELIGFQNGRTNKYTPFEDPSVDKISSRYHNIFQLLEKKTFVPRIPVVENQQSASPVLMICKVRK
jgi:hypothetical protein